MPAAGADAAPAGAPARAPTSCDAAFARGAEATAACAAAAGLLSTGVQVSGVGFLLDGGSGIDVLLRGDRGLLLDCRRLGRALRATEVRVGVRRKTAADEHRQAH